MHDYVIPLVLNVSSDKCMWACDHILALFHILNNVYLKIHVKLLISGKCPSQKKEHKIVSIENTINDFFPNLLNKIN